MTVNEILEKYTNGDMPLDEANEALAKETEGKLKLDPNRNLFSPQELMETRIGETPDQANGWGIMDHGVGCLEKVHVVDGKTPDVNMGEEIAFVYIAGRKYELKGDTLVGG